VVSIIVPAYREPYLNKTVDSLLKNAEGEVEILVILDGQVPEEPVITDPRVKITVLPKNLGMRASLNAGFTKATGEFIMKVDAHCNFAPGYDRILSEDCQENWLMIPRRYSLREDTWDRNEKLPKRDYHYLCFPGASNQGYGYSFQVQNWPVTGKDDILIDDTMAFQGSCFMANRKYFMDHVGLLDDVHYGSFVHDQQETGLKYWLGDGEVKVNKKTWYSHLQKRGAHYKTGVFSHRHKKDVAAINGNLWATKYWMNNEEPNMKHPFSWLVEKFWPVPTWEEDWQEKWREHGN